MNLSPFTLFLGGLILGTSVTMATVPSAIKSNHCETYTVSRKVATAYVLRPPPSIPAEPVKCPLAVAPAVCPAPAQVDSENKPDVEDVQKPHRRHHRHHRRRAYWR